MAEVVEINDLEQLRHYQSDWDHLFERTPQASFFHTYDWFATHWNHFGTSRKMRVLIVRSGNVVTGIVPLHVVKERHRLSTVRVLTYPLSDWGMWYGPLGPYQSATMFMAMEHLRGTAQEWDLIDLRWTPTDPTGHDVTRRAMTAVGWKPQRELYQQSSIVRFEGTTWDGYLAGLTRKWRHEIRRTDRNLSRLGDVDFVRYRAEVGSNDPGWNIFNECLEVSRQSWQANVRNGNTICHASVLPFIKECHAHATRLGMSDMTVLRLNGKPIAYHYNYCHRGEVIGLRMGYVQEARHLGAGKTLLTRQLEDSFARGDILLDLGIGEFDFKTRFRTGVAQSYHYSFCPWHSWRYQGVRLSRWVRQKLVGGDVHPSKPAVAPTEKATG